MSLHVGAAASMVLAVVVAMVVVVVVVVVGFVRVVVAGFPKTYAFLMGVGGFFRKLQVMSVK